jgi:hypothetical protein
VSTRLADLDARASNWRYVVPSEPTVALLAAPGGVSVETVLSGPEQDALVAPDLGGWSDRTSPRPGPALAAGQLLEALCGRVAPGGWLCVGFANRWYLARPLARGSLSLGAARRVLARTGLTAAVTYVALPDHRHPALLVPADRAAELDHVLHRMLLTYVPNGAPLPRLSRRVLAALRAAAVRAPHRLRVRLLPGYLLVARRPS